MDLPGGVVTFVFSDIEGSTLHWESDPAGMRRSLARHDEIVRTAVEGAGGIVFKHTGDGFGAAFDSVTAGLEAAARAAATLADEEWDGPALRCRFGVHSGEAEPTDADYFGPTVTRTVRLMDAGNGGQIVVSEAARRLVAGPAAAAMRFAEAGEHRLKDLGEPIRVYRLITPGADDPRELRTLERAPHNLPLQLSTFVGRESQIKEVTDLVRQSRLVTLTGIGGVGKTRLSLQVAAELLGEFDDGAWFVELASLAEPGLIADTASNALGVPQDSTLAPDERLLRFLGERRALVLIDNCEHLIDDVAGFVDGLLRRCPEVHVVATSREGLGVTGEVLWRVPSLRVDDDAAAVELFAERARLVQPRFKITEDNLQTVAELCTRLDGIPLAIELATARLKMLTVDQIARLLNDRFRLLTGGSRTAVERQRTLRAMMDWSYDLLAPTEQALLRRLAVFYDGFTYEAAEEVCSGETLARFEILDLLGHLVEASVVTFEADVRPRYRLLETVRQYALDKLVEAGEADEARLRHAEHFCRVSRTIRDSLDAGDFTAMDLATDDLGNHRAAMTWAIEAGRSELALESACNLRMYFWNRVMYRESARWLRGALDLVGDTESPMVPIGAAFAITDAGNAADATAILDLLPRVRRLHEAAANDSDRGLLANALASIEITNDARRADELFAEAHDLLRAVGDVRWTSPLQNRFLTAWMMDSAHAKDEVLALAADAIAGGVFLHEAVVRIAFALVEGEYQHVIDFVEHRSPLDEWEEGMLLLFRAHAERATGLLEEARATLQRVDTVLGSRVQGPTDWELGMLFLQLGDLDSAVEAFSAVGAYSVELPDRSTRAAAATFWGMVAERQGDHRSAAILFGFAGRLSEETSTRPPAFDRELIAASLERVRSALGEEQTRELQRRGSESNWEDLPMVHERRAREAAQSVAED